MNREIKFRAWDYDVIQEKYVIRNFESIKNNCGAYFFEPQKYQPNPHILMQFTGMKDTKGNDIYEGDILQWTSSNPFSKGEAKKVQVKYVQARFWCQGTIGVYLGELLYCEKCEIVGNIYENPELL